jgi:hypothetical protein
MLKAKLYKNFTPSNDDYFQIHVSICENFFPRLKGLMFQQKINRNEGLLFINQSENRIDAAIHMFFMKFDIAVFWINQNNIIVDRVIAKKWHPFYIPRYNAKIILETHKENFDLFSIGDTLIIEKI